MPQIHVNLSELSKAAWIDFAVENGVSITGLVEFMGVAMKQDPEFARIIRDELVKGARVVDAERRRR